MEGEIETTDVGYSCGLSAAALLSFSLQLWLIAMQGCLGAGPLPGGQNDRAPAGYGHIGLRHHGAHGRRP